MKYTLEKGTKINRFQVEAEVGHGGMGVVYRSHDPVLNRPVALKLLAPHLGAEPQALARFHREAALVASLKHTHIATVYEFGEYDERPFIAMEWVEGRTLKQLLAEEGPLPPERALHLCQQLAGALDYAHEHGVIHRDLKPANIMVGAGDEVTIVDFGLAWLESDPSITATGSILGTPLYMSPEHIQGKPLDGRSDLYSLAVITYEMLAGHPPFQNDNMPALLHQQLYELPAPITETNPALNGAIAYALEKGLSKDPTDRFPTAFSFNRALREMPAILVGRRQGNGLLLPAKDKPSHRSWGWMVPAFLAATLTGLALGAFLTYTYFSQNQPASPEFTPATQTATENSETTDTGMVPSEAADSVEPLSEEVPVPFDAPLPDGYWDMSGGESHQNNFVYAPWFPTGSGPRWQFHPDTGDGTDLIGSDGIILFAAGDTLYALDWTTGEKRWETRLGAEITATPAIHDEGDDGIVMVATTDGELYGLQLSDAALMWRIRPDDLGGTVPRALAFGTDSTLFAATDAGLVHVIDPHTGSIITRVDLSGQDEFIQPPAATTIGLYLAGNSGTLYAIDPNTETVAWTAGTNGSPSTAPLLAEGWGYLAIGTNAGWVQTFSLVGGNLVWEAELDGPVAGIAGDWSYLYAVTTSGTLYAWNGFDGALRWEHALETEVIAPPVTNNELVMVATADGRICVFELESGTQLEEFKFEADGPLHRSPTPIGGWLFLRTPNSVSAFGPVE